MWFEFQPRYSRCLRSARETKVNKGKTKLFLLGRHFGVLFHSKYSDFVVRSSRSKSGPVWCERSGEEPDRSRGLSSQHPVERERNIHPSSSWQWVEGRPIPPVWWSKPVTQRLRNALYTNIPSTQWNHYFILRLVSQKREKVTPFHFLTFLRLVSAGNEENPNPVYTPLLQNDDLVTTEFLGQFLEVLCLFNFWVQALVRASH